MSAHPFGYTGRRWDGELGLYYYRARWYDPELGTFLQTDPIGALDYINLYSYVGLEPGNATDPSGLSAVTKLIKQTIKHKGNLIEAVIDVGGTLVTVIAPSSTPMDRLFAIAEIVSPISPSDIKDAKKVVDAIGKTGGRKGGADTRAQLVAIGKKIEDSHGSTPGGFGRKESYFATPDGSKRGRYSDGSATTPDGQKFEVQTVDTNRRGNMTADELEAAEDIATVADRPVVCVPKKPCTGK